MAKKQTRRAGPATARKKGRGGRTESTREGGRDGDEPTAVVDPDGTVVTEDDAEEGDAELDAAEGDAELDAEIVDVDEPDLEDLGEPVVKLPPPPESSHALSLRDPLQAYVREVQRYPLLTLDEERELTTRYHETGDPAIARRLVTANLRLVIKLAYEYRRAYKNMMDLIQEGNIGLMQAVTRFDPYRGVKLSSYSAWWIRAYMLRFILNNWRLVKLGTTQAQRKLFFNLNKQKSKLAAMGIEPTPQRIAERLGVKESEVIEMDRRLASAEASLDAPLHDASQGRTVPRVEMMASDVRETDEAVARAQLSEMLNERLARFRETLSGKELVIFDKRLVAEDPYTLQRLGDEFGVSRERVRQIEARLAGRLRDYLKKELGDAVELGV